MSDPATATTPDAVKQLHRQLDEANTAYHNGAAIITDHEYDQLLEQLAEVAPDDPRLSRVGEAPPANTPLGKVEHSILMGSTAKITSEEEFVRWHKNAGAPALIASHKLDGISCALYYEGGKLVRAVTRGDGEVGEDITHNAVHFRCMPRVLARDTGDFVVRGEVVLTAIDWEAVDPDQESNPRNLAAGIARRLDSENAERLTFIAFDMHGVACKTKRQQMVDLVQLGFRVVDGRPTADSHEAAAYFHEVNEARPNLDYWIDGVIFEVDDREAFEAMGVTDQKPKGMIAWKPEAETATTTLREVTWQIGAAQGAVTPVAHFDPVRLGGSTVSKASLSNWDEIQRLGLQIGSPIEVIKANDIIPKVTSAKHPPRGQEGPLIEKPAAIDGYPVGHRTNSDSSRTVHLYVDPRHPKVQFGKVKNWVKKTDMKGLGDEVLEALMAETYIDPKDWNNRLPLLATIPDLYSLHKLGALGGETIADIKVNGKKLGEKRAQKILDEIEAKRKLTIDQFLGSLGLPHLGRRRVQLIREAWRSNVAGSRVGDWAPDALDDLASWFSAKHTFPDGTRSLITHFADKLGIPGIASEVQAAIDGTRPLIEEVLAAGVEIERKYTRVPMKTVGGDGPEFQIRCECEHEFWVCAVGGDNLVLVDEKWVARCPSCGGVQGEHMKEESPLNGKAFCFTGIRPSDHEKERMEQLGIEVKSGVSKNVDYLVCKDPEAKSSKLDKARGLGIELVSHDQFQEMIK